MKRLIALLVSLVLAGAVAQGEPVRTIELLTRPQAAAPQEFQSAQLVAQAWRQLGLDVDVRAMPWEQLADLVWYDREAWDATAWQMVGRPERGDPDEIVFNLFHSSTAESGYNFIGYDNPEYNAVVEAQRSETDLEARQELIHEAQQILAEDQPYLFLVHPQSTYAFRSDVWDADSIVEQNGIGIKNFWSFVEAQPVSDQTDMVLNSADVVQAINPLYISGSVDSWITELIWDRLLRIGPDGLPQPWAAASYEWLDETTIDVVLREGMTWHDGEAVTVEDVVFSFRAPMGEEAPMYTPFVSGIDNVEALDERTVRFSLSEPSAAFLVTTLAKVNIIPKHVWGPILSELEGDPENAESHQEEMPVGSGPFRYVRWRSSEEVVLEANPDHFAAPGVGRWILRIVPNAEAALGMLRRGELNFLSDYAGDPQVLLETAEGAPIEVVSSTDIGFRFIGFNERRAPFDDEAFRRALSFAVNRDLIAQAAYRGFGVPSNSPVSPALPFWHDASVMEFETGIDLARGILEEAGYAWDGSGNLLAPNGADEARAN